ncbi:crossover junction endodeoxyribonuclease RuvC [Sphingosinicella microcystinivorans]|uniref:crossover junction endodeoxyribonuclease RuvC n=1 Tax=Sphingosinicella microcystinivorans TaxID=335406 RepID=UPI0022F3F3E5|nr:crossover junction endodeoxyribonuclease RuvC [Sphingosinicella microcystinivorans]WBX86409.1 crossover junction endodeoxyribonuclease RuvC [Sphingosinicella microcystinivorans]
MIILGVDPGLNATGWGVIRAEGNRISHIAHGTLRIPADAPLAARLSALYTGVAGVVAESGAETAAAEEVFVNKNPQSTLKLGQARGAVLAALAGSGLEVAEYATRLVKKALVGTGGAEKDQVRAMVERLMPGVKIRSADAADALAVAVCHAHHLASAKALGGYAR